jgi:cellulose synthase/poly-beta-1,6-N-acetylglucosamine synthase-like glycosyltransferase
VRIYALVPAHNEEASIAATIQSLLAQTRPPDEIMVIVNNSTDRTAEISRGFPGIEVLDIPECKGRKAGALNQALDKVLPGLGDDDLILSMDADTELALNLIENGSKHFDDPHLGALSSNHLVMKHSKILELLQAIEYERDRVFIGRHKGKGGCMTGMAAMFRVSALRDVKRKYGTVYDPANWTEDWKLTIGLRHLGWGMIRPQDCLVSTVPVSRIGGLFKQRERWARGYLQTLIQFGWTRKTAILWLKQGGFLFSVIVRLLYFVMLGTLITGHHNLVAWWMIPIAVVFAADSIMTVRGAGKWAMLVAAIFPIEIAYSWLLTAAIASGYFKQLTGLGANDTWVNVRGA